MGVTEALRIRISETNRLIETMQASPVIPLSLAANIRSLEKLRHKLEGDLQTVERTTSVSSPTSGEANK